MSGHINTPHRTELIRQVGSYREYDPAEDYDLGLRLAEKYPVETLDDVLVKYRIHETNTSYNSRERLKRSLKGILSDMHLRLGMPVSEKLTDVHYTYFTEEENEFTVSDYYTLFMELKQANYRLNIYDSGELRKLLFKKWYEVVLKKGGKKAFPLLFKRAFYKPSFVTFKQFRKTFKKSFKDLFG